VSCGASTTSRGYGGRFPSALRSSTPPRRALSLVGFPPQRVREAALPQRPADAVGGGRPPERMRRGMRLASPVRPSRRLLPPRQFHRLAPFPPSPPDPSRAAAVVVAVFVTFDLPPPRIPTRGARVPPAHPRCCLCRVLPRDGRADGIDDDRMVAVLASASRASRAPLVTEGMVVYPKQWFPRRHAQPRQSNSQHAGALFTTSCCNPLAVHVCADEFFSWLFSVRGVCGSRMGEGPVFMECTCV